MLHTIEDFSQAPELKADVCIAGGGPAGITLALSLAERGISSILLEAGPIGKPSKEQKDPYRGSYTGLRYPLMSSRQRCFGGTSRHWGGWCKPLDAVDFDQHPSTSLPSWPISLADIEPYYPKALKMCEIPDDRFDAGTTVTDVDHALMKLDEGGFTNQLFRFSPPTRFNHSYGKDIEANASITCICEAALTNLEVEGDIVRSAQVRGLKGEELTVTADHFVLAMGGIEVARFLLHLAAESGVNYGQESNLLGHCFMDHFGFHPGFLEAPSTAKYFRHEQDGLPIMPVATASEALQREQGWPSICVMAKPDSPEQILPPAYFSNAGIVGSVEGTGTQRFRLQLICEPTANIESRITLGKERDILGMRRPVLNWNVVTEDFEKPEAFMGQFERAVGLAGVGRVQRTQSFVGKARTQLSVGWHHMGTTRMSDNPRYGIVDPNSKVFGSANLFIASSSVFPRVGYSNPTLTIIALAERLAAHLDGGSA